MSNAKRRINSTGRKKIRREEIDIRLLEAKSGEPLRAKATLALDSYKFPPESLVSIEAYHRSSGMRFDCGSVGALQIPPLLVLDQVDRSGSVLFRVKVIDAGADIGKILGVAERVQPVSEECSDGKKSLFPVVYRDLGQQVWKVEINDGDRPKLILNCGIPGISDKLRSDTLLQAFLFPAALRIVLERLVTEPDDDDDDEPGWKIEWLEFCKDGLGIRDDPTILEATDKLDWVERAVSGFCGIYHFMENIRKMNVDGGNSEQVSAEAQR
jgi:hypothetical protein